MILCKNPYIDLQLGDCLELMPLIQDKSIDMILADLPYGITGCNWDIIIPFDSLWKLYERIIKDNGAIVLFGSEPFSSYLRLSNIDKYKYDWYWNKTKPNGFAHSKNKPMRKIEIISIFSKAPMGHTSLLGDKRMKYNPQGIISVGKRTVKNSSHSGNTMGGKNKKSSRPNQVGKEYEGFTNFPNDVLEYMNITGIKAIHPTQKPVKLFEYLIRTYTNEGEIVLDNVAGSGTTGIACYNTNRNAILMEKDEKYFEMAKKRIENHVKQLNLWIEQF